ncbi:MAG: hypothetical protein OEW15_04375 [Nitrospirota bacterium]|nr:hypothetical protein [Nitrospirota bacterium]
MATRPDQELHHAIFGSILDQAEMTPFLLQPATDYFTSLKQATRMMANRGFDTLGSDMLRTSERERAAQYIRRSFDYCFKALFPFVSSQLEGLVSLRSPNQGLYRSCLASISAVSQILNDRSFQALLADDPRHLLLLASSRKYSFVFSGYQGREFAIPAYWQEAACCLLKTIYLIKSVEEDSQDINDVAQLGFFFEDRGIGLNDLYWFDWEHPAVVPDTEAAQRAYVKIATFFHRLNESLGFDREKGCLVFNSGDGVEIKIAEVKARLKSPESMVTKLGKTVEGEAFDIRDILAITFILQDMHDTLKLFHALQKQGVILQDNTVSPSITQTLFDDPAAMQEAVRRLMVSLAKGRGRDELPDEEQVALSSSAFYDALSKNADSNAHTSKGHRKFQCKIGFSVPIHRAVDTNEILIPGTAQYARRDSVSKKTEQHTLGVELRISDVKSWRKSEQTGESHHDAYKFRQLISVMNRLFKGMFHFPRDNHDQLRKDQAALFS